MRSGLRDFSQPVGEWLNARDTDRRRLRDQARDRLSPSGTTGRTSARRAAPVGRCQPAAARPGPALGQRGPQ